MKTKNKIFKISNSSNIVESVPNIVGKEILGNKKCRPGNENENQIILFSKNYDNDFLSEENLIKKKRKNINKFNSNIEREEELKDKKFKGEFAGYNSLKNNDNKKRRLDSINESNVNKQSQNEFEGNNKAELHNFVNNLKVKILLKKNKHEKNYMCSIKHKKRIQNLKEILSPKLEKCKKSGEWSYNKNDYLFYGPNKNVKKKTNNFIIKIPMEQLN